jgi:hypothetical protein
MLVDPFVGPMARAERLVDSDHRYRVASGEVQLPIQYDEAHTVLVILPASLGALQSLVPAPLRPQRLHGDRGALILQFVDMPRTTIGPYRECAVSVALREDRAWPEATDIDWRPSPSYVLWLSVTSAIARDSGQAVWGYPKVVADTQFTLAEGRFRGHVDLGNGAVIACAGKAPRTEEWSSVQMRAITGRGDSMLRSVIAGRGHVAEAAAEEGDVDLELTGGSPITDALLGMDLGPAAGITVVEKYTYALTAPLPARAKEAS